METLTFDEFVRRISWVMVPPGGSTDPDGDSICSVKLFGTAAWNRYCSSVFSELFVANMITRKQPSPTLLLGTNVIFNPFLSKAVILTPPLFELVVELPVRSSNRLLPKILLPVVGDNGDRVFGSIEMILLPFVVFRLSLAAIVDGVVIVSLPNPPSKSSKSALDMALFGVLLLEYCLSDGFNVGDVTGLMLPPSRSSKAF